MRKEPCFDVNQSTKLDEISIVIDLVCYSGTSNDGLIIPDNHAEVFVPIGSDLEVRSIASKKIFRLKQGCQYFCLPRSRGLMLLANPRVHVLIAKVNPLYAVWMSKNLERISSTWHIFRPGSSLAKKIDLFSMEDKSALNTLLMDYLKLPQKKTVGHDVVLKSMEMIKKACGVISIKELCSLLNVKKSSLERSFQNIVGISPKEYCKIEKLNCFVNSFKHDQKLTTQVYKFGYYDQSHLIKDFNYFFELSPRVFFKLSDESSGT